MVFPVCSINSHKEDVDPLIGISEHSGTCVLSISDIGDCVRENQDSSAPCVVICLQADCETLVCLSI